jgi:hypothetical protein
MINKHQILNEVNNMRKLDKDKLNFKESNITSEKALEDVEPFNWNEEVLNGNKKIIVDKSK